ncbi:MAG TPA: FecR domain-containing protein [Rhizomicrobium sp.]|nr:FecR domain-containing protein [Rhizomicrobium sp.]
MSEKTNSIEEEAARWIRRKEFGDWNETAMRACEAWLDQSLLHRVAYLRLEEGWKRTERLAALREPEFRRSSPARSPRRWNGLLRVAAAVTVVAAMALTAQPYIFGASDDVYSTPVGGRTVLTLYDGSHVELNTDTVLRLGKNRRSATLVKGEAFFDIKHDSKNPFVVMASGHRITDLGTRFSVRGVAPGQLEVALMEGKARIENTEDGARQHTAVLKPGDVAFASASGLKVTRKPVETLVNAVSWRNGMVVFRHMSLADAAAEFNRYTQTKLVVDPAIAHLAIDGTFATGNPETFARILRVALGLKIETRAQQIIITR